MPGLGSGLAEIISAQHPGPGPVTHRVMCHECHTLVTQNEIMCTYGDFNARMKSCLWEALVLHSKPDWFPMLVTRGPTLPMVRWSHPTSADPGPCHNNTPGESCLSQGILRIPQPILRLVTRLARSSPVKFTSLYLEIFDRGPTRSRIS